MRRLLLPAAVCAVAVSVVAVVNAGGRSTVTLRFDEKSTLFKVIDNPPTDAGQAPESGDIVLFASDLTSGGRKVGTNRGFCTVVDPPKAECSATFFFNARGSLGGVDTFDFSSNKPQAIAVMGGTGSYRGTRGEARVTQVSATLAHWVVRLTR